MQMGSPATAAEVSLYMIIAEDFHAQDRKDCSCRCKGFAPVMLFKLAAFCLTSTMFPGCKYEILVHRQCSDYSIPSTICIHSFFWGGGEGGGVCEGIITPVSELSIVSKELMSAEMTTRPHMSTQRSIGATQEKQCYQFLCPHEEVHAFWQPIACKPQSMVEHISSTHACISVDSQAHP